MSSALCRRAVITKLMLGVVTMVLLQLLRDERGGTRSLLVQAFYPSAPTRSSASSLSCICVDCQWVTSCKAYHFVETKHEQPHMSKDPTFLPREGSPTIQVNIRTEPRKPEPGATPRMWKDQLENDEEQDEPKKDASYYEETGTIETVKTNTTTTIEYDIVKCADFVLDKGCWVRNMPEEIRRVNPDFVPT